MHLAGEFRVSGMNCFITSPSSQQHKEVNFHQVNIPTLPPCSAQNALNHGIDSSCPSLNALFSVVCKSTKRSPGPLSLSHSCALNPVLIHLLSPFLIHLDICCVSVRQNIPQVLDYKCLFMWITKECYNYL